MRPVGDYIKIARKAHIVWMDGSEVGMVQNRGVQYPVYLWPYKVGSLHELVAVFTHEIVHLAHPELSGNEGAVDSIAVALLKKELKWVLTATYLVGSALYRGVVRILKKKGISIDL